MPTRVSLRELGYSCNEFDELLLEQTMACLLLVAVATTAISADSLQRFAEIQEHMGTKFELVVFAETEDHAAKALTSGFQRIAKLNAVMSDYVAESELSCLSRTSPSQSPAAVSIDLFTVLASAQRLSERTSGAFDVTVGPLTKLWRRAHRRREFPDGDLLQTARDSTGFKNLTLDATMRTAQLRLAKMRLDLGGIAKGYAADEALKAIGKHGITRALVNAGGDVVTGDPPPGELGWRVGVASRERDRPPVEFLLIANQAVATSGDVWQHVEIDGVRYSHILDPHTGLGLTTQSSVTVVAPIGMDADSLASAISVLGVEKGLKLIESLPQTEALILTQSDSAVVADQSSGFAKLVEVE